MPDQAGLAHPHDSMERGIHPIYKISDKYIRFILPVTEIFRAHLATQKEWIERSFHIIKFIKQFV